MKFCGNCGAKMEDGEQYCSYCGTRFESAARRDADTNIEMRPAPQYSAQSQHSDPMMRQLPTQKTNGFAVAGFVMGLISILFCWCCFGVTQILGVIFSAVALSQIKKTGEGGKGLAVAGLVLSVLCIVLSAVFAVLSALASDVYPYYDYGYYEYFGDFLPTI